jgi:hypothetical protein
MTLGFHDGNQGQLYTQRSEIFDQTYDKAEYGMDRRRRYNQLEYTDDWSQSSGPKVTLDYENVSQEDNGFSDWCDAPGLTQDDVAEARDVAVALDYDYTELASC